MSLRRAIHQVLTTDEALTALINGRHYSVNAPQGTPRPYLVTQIVVSTPEQTHGNPDENEDTLDEALVQHTAVADNADVAADVIAAARRAWMDPEREAAAALIAAAGLVVTSPEERQLPPDDTADPEPIALHQLDVTIFHNPSA